MLEAAVYGLADGAGHAEAGILGVSVLTSLDKADLQRIGINRTPGQLVSKMASVAASSGCEGVVCSPLELHVVHQSAPQMITVVPGIRPTAVGDDQARTATPSEAIGKGASYLVIGRPITGAEDPAHAAAAINEILEASERQR
jgi:orotidine-5'-phosphate decarboxylase